jgi:predicted transcriptional regulator
MRFSSVHPTISALGSLEISVLRESWASASPVDAQCVLERVGQGRISLSTVQATLERLCRKKLLTRQKVGRAYIYSPSISKPQLIGTLIRDLTQRLTAGELEPVICGFVDLVGDAGPESLERLSAATERRRRAVTQTSSSEDLA